MADLFARTAGKGKFRVAVAAALGLVLLLFTTSPGQQVRRNGFETKVPGWVKGPADAPCKETIHEISDQAPHTGQYAEHWAVVAEMGTHIHYFYPVGRAVVSEETTAGVWVKANRPGLQLLARLVLPKERNSQNLAEPMTTMLRGEIYQLAGRWQRLDIRRPSKLAKEQQQLVRAELQRDVDFTDAYIDQLVLNVYGGPGVNEVWADDLEIGPVAADSTEAQPAIGAATSRPLPKESRAATVELNQDRLVVNGKRFLLRGIRTGDLPLQALLAAGFNTVWFDAAATPEQLEAATEQGLLVAVVLPVRTDQPLTSQNLEPVIGRFLQSASVLLWDLGGGRTLEEAQVLARTAQAVKTVDPHRPVAVDVWDGFLPYSRNFDLMGAHRWPLGTGLELSQYREWLNQRRLLARPGSYWWTWVQTHVPEWYVALLNDGGNGASPIDLAGPQPEQVRLLAYTALAAGCQGLAFWSDRNLSAGLGRDRFFGLALLNQELQMLEPLLLSILEPPIWIDTSIPDVKAAVIRTEKGVLVLPIWQGKGAQFVPGQSAVARLTLTVPQVPAGAQVWEVSPGDVRSLKEVRVPGGTQVTLPEFGLTGAVVFTSDINVVVRLQDQARKVRKLAAQWAHDLAEIEMEKVLKVDEELEKLGLTIPDSQELKKDAQERLRNSVTYFNGGDHREAYHEAQRALRPLRILMRAQWESAIRGLDAPVASPFAVSYYTLPRHGEFIREVRRLESERKETIANVLPDGDFETEQSPSAWMPQEGTIDEVAIAGWRVGEQPREGQRCLKLEITPKDAAAPPAALERTFLAVNSMAAQLKPGTLVRISGWVRIPKPITASVDGALFYDSAGGEPLAVRLNGPIPWRKFTLYRKVPSSGSVHVTLALTGIGVAYFDDVRIEPLQ